MGIFQSFKNIFSKAAPVQPPPPPLLVEEEEIEVPEVSVEELQAELSLSSSQLLLDVREHLEWNQVHIPSTESLSVLHIPMNSVPDRLDEIPKDAEVVVLCAHGQRSYGVAGYLIEEGYQARSLAGGITMWHIRGGDVTVNRG